MRSRFALLVVIVLAPFAYSRVLLGQCGVVSTARYGGNTTAVAQLTSTHIVVARGAGLYLYNIANPNAPVAFSATVHRPLPGHAVKIAYTPGSPRVFVLLESGDVVVYTVSTSPSLSLGFPVTIDLTYRAVDIAADGQRVVIAESVEFAQAATSRLRLYDLSSGTPQLLRTVQPLADVYVYDRLAIVGTKVWAAFHEFESSIYGVDAFDLASTPVMERVTTSLNSVPLGTFTRVSAMAAAGNTLLLSYAQDSNEDWMRAVDVSTPTAPSWRPPVDLNGDALCMNAIGSHLRISIANAGVGTWDISNPSALTWLGAYFSTSTEVTQISSMSGTDFWANGRSGLMIMNTTTIAPPTLRSTINAGPVSPTVVRQTGTITAILDPYLANVRLHDYSTNTLRSTIAVPSNTFGIEFIIRPAGVTLLAIGYGQIAAYDVNSPTSPFLVSTLTGVYPSVTTTNGRYLYYTLASTTTNYVVIVDYNTPASPVIRSTTSFGGDPHEFNALAAWSNTLAIGTESLGLWLLDVTSPTAPQVVRVLNPGSNYAVRSLLKGPSYLYVSAEVDVFQPSVVFNTRLETIDVANPVAASVVWYSDVSHGAGLPPELNAMTYVGTATSRFIYGSTNVLDDSDTLSVFSLEDPARPTLIETQNLDNVIGPYAVLANGAGAIGAGNEAGLCQVNVPVQWAPRFVEGPQSTRACPGQSAVISLASPVPVTASPTNVTYAWYRAGTQLTDGPTAWGSVVSGTTGPTLTFTTPRPNDRASYYCVATNSCGSTYSATVRLNLCIADYDCSGSVTPQDIFSFLNDWFAAAPRADINGLNGISPQDIFDFLNEWFFGC